MARKYNKSTGRDYKAEYERYQGNPDQKKKRALRNKARRKMIRSGKAKVGDGKDVAHKSNDVRDSSMKNLVMQSRAVNRAEPRLRRKRRTKK